MCARARDFTYHTHTHTHTYSELSRANCMVNVLHRTTHTQVYSFLHFCFYSLITVACELFGKRPLPHLTRHLFWGAEPLTVYTLSVSYPLLFWGAIPLTVHRVLYHWQCMIIVQFFFDCARMRVRRWAPEIIHIITNVKVLLYLDFWFIFFLSIFLYLSRMSRLCTEARLVFFMKFGGPCSSAT